MRPTSRVVLVLMLASALSGPLPAAEMQAPSVAVDDAAMLIPVVADDGGVTEPAQELPEVVVRGNRLWQLREAMIEAEDRFYALYNELNTNDDFDVHCRREAPLGTRIKSRVCRVAYHEDAQAEYAQGLLGGFYAPNPDTVLLERRDEYRDAALAVINGNRRLRRLAQERERLEQRYEEERRKRFKGRWIIFE